MKRISILLLLFLLPLLAFGEDAKQGFFFKRPKAKLEVNKDYVEKGEKVILSWTAENGDASLNDERVESTGTKEVVVNESSTYTLTVAGKRRKATDSVTVEIMESVPDDNPTPEPVEGFALSAIGFGSAFNVDDNLSAASRDHELGAFIKSQNGTWTIITDEVLSNKHPKVFDEWVQVLDASGKKKPCVIWHNQGKVLAIDEVAGKTKEDLLTMAKAVVPATNEKVLVQGKVYSLGLLPPKKGVKYSGPSVTQILKPLYDCPSVDLSSQVLYYKKQVAGTCVLQSFAGACEAALYTMYGPDNCPELNPYFLANLTNGYNGTWGSDAAEMVQKYGNLLKSDMEAHGRLPRGWKTKASRYKCIALYGPPKDGDSPGYIRAALNRGYIVCTGISVGSGFDPDKDGYISYERGAGRQVNHEIRVIGWNQEKRRFLIANSWGKNWGVNGSAWLDEKFFEADSDIWVVVGMTASPNYKFYAPVKNEKGGWFFNRPDPTPPTPPGPQPDVIPNLSPKITASATQVESGDQVIIIWTNTPDTTLCTLNGQTVPTNGSKEVYPTKDVTYAIIAYDKNGNTQASWVRVDVLQKDEKEKEIKGLKSIIRSAVEKNLSCPDGKCDTCPDGTCPYSEKSETVKKSCPDGKCNTQQYQKRGLFFRRR